VELLEASFVLCKQGVTGSIPAWPPTPARHFNYLPIPRLPGIRKILQRLGTTGHCVPFGTDAPASGCYL
jgi:hypothetical protein